MFTLISRIIATAMLGMVVTGCNPTAQDTQESTEKLEQIEEIAAKEAAADGKIECAVSGEKTFVRSCETEKIVGPEGQILIIRHPNGGFRRFKILTDGRGLTPAEGADSVEIQLLTDGKIEVAIAGDHYRLPAKIKQSASPAPGLMPASEPAPTK